jgi:adenylate cyclase class 2
MLEQEIKLEFESVEAARRSITATGARLEVSQRLLEDRLFDTEQQHLRQAGTALRVRRDGTRAILTFKGPAQPAHIKSREEIETGVGDAEVAEAILHGLGFRCWFRSQKRREEYRLGKALVTIDDTPIGVFVEIEAAPDDIDRVATQLGRSRADYRLESYPRLYARWREAKGIEERDMLFRDLKI